VAAQMLKKGFTKVNPNAKKESKDKQMEAK